MDASGTPIHPDVSSSVFVLGGACLHESNWLALDDRVAELKQSYAIPGSDFELHAKDFCVSFGEQREVPDFAELSWAERRDAVLAIHARKVADTPRGEARDARRDKYRAQAPFVHLTRTERSRLFEDALDLVGSREGVRLFAEVVDKAHLHHDNCLRHALEQVVSRFDAFLAHANTPTRTRRDHGLLVMDREPTYERYIESIYDEFRHRGHPWGRLQDVIESPFFVDSRRASGVQVVDLCIYAVRRYVEYGLRPGKIHEEQNFLRIFHKFDRSGPKLHGLRHYCAKKSCDCLICRDRGHARADLESHSTA